MQTSLQFQRFVYLLEYVNVVERHVLSGGPGRQPVVVVRVFRSMRVNIELDHATHVRFSPDCRQVTSLNI